MASRCLWNSVNVLPNLAICAKSTSLELLILVNSTEETLGVWTLPRIASQEPDYVNGKREHGGDERD
ncbi:hypothetical protein V6N13_027823 [Hibiscus sabdariffa]